MARISIERRALPPQLLKRLPRSPTLEVGILKEGTETVHASDRAGLRTVIARISDGEIVASHSSQPGGANPFTGDTSTDLPIKPGYIAIHWHGHGKWADAEAFPEDLAALGAEDPDPEDEGASLEVRAAVSIVQGTKSSYRADAAERLGLTYSKDDPVFAEALARGYLKANKAGAISATAKGKNLPGLSWEERRTLENAKRLRAGERRIAADRVPGDPEELFTRSPARAPSPPPAWEDRSLSLLSRRDLARQAGREDVAAELDRQYRSGEYIAGSVTPTIRGPVPEHLIPPTDEEKSRWDAENAARGASAPFASPEIPEWLSTGVQESAEDGGSPFVVGAEDAAELRDIRRAVRALFAHPRVEQGPSAGIGERGGQVFGRLDRRPFSVIVEMDDEPSELGATLAEALGAEPPAARRAQDLAGDYSAPKAPAARKGVPKVAPNEWDEILGPGRMYTRRGLIAKGADWRRQGEPFFAWVALYAALGPERAAKVAREGGLPIPPEGPTSAAEAFQLIEDEPMIAPSEEGEREADKVISFLAPAPRAQPDAGPTPEEDAAEKARIATRRERMRSVARSGGRVVSQEQLDPETRYTVWTAIEGTGGAIRYTRERTFPGTAFMGSGGKAEWINSRSPTHGEPVVYLDGADPNEETDRSRRADLERLRAEVDALEKQLETLGEELEAKRKQRDELAEALGERKASPGPALPKGAPVVVGAHIRDAPGKKPKKKQLFPKKAREKIAALEKKLEEDCK